MPANKPADMPANSPRSSSPPRHAERRREARLHDAVKQLHFVFDGCTLVTVNWSTGGCMVQAAPGMEAGDMVEGALQTREGIPISIIAAQILRIDDLGRAALRFDAFDSLI
jgi:hypothetical protein